MQKTKQIQSYPARSQWRQHLSRVIGQGKPEGDEKDHEVDIGVRLQAFRQMRGFSQRALAKKCGLNFNTLSLIETGKTSPNVSTLQQLAFALDVPVTAFFEPVREQAKVVYQKSGRRTMVDLPQGVFEDLGGGLAVGEGTPLLMTLRPHTTSKANPIVHTGQEFVFCLEGEITFYLDEQPYQLLQGDSLIFEAHIPHRWENRHDREAKALLIICPAEKNDRSVAQHLSEPSESGG